MTTNGKTCGTCRHWHKQQSMDLSVQEGLCREQLHSAIIGRTPDGRFITHTYYPAIPAAFPCCDKHSPMVVRSLELKE